MITVNQRVQVIAEVVGQAEAVVVEEVAVEDGGRTVGKMENWSNGVLEKTTNDE